MNKNNRLRSLWAVVDPKDNSLYWDDTCLVFTSRKLAREYIREFNPSHKTTRIIKMNDYKISANGKEFII